MGRGRGNADDGGGIRERPALFAECAKKGKADGMPDGVTDDENVIAHLDVSSGIETSSMAGRDSADGGAFRDIFARDGSSCRSPVRVRLSG